MKPNSILLFLLLGATTHAAPTASAPATLLKEGDLTTITLKPESEAYLRLKTVPVERRVIPAVRLFSGEVVLPLGSDRARLGPVLGGTLDETLRLADLQAAGDGRVLQAQAQFDGAKLAHDRALKVLESEAGSPRAADEARTAFAIAEAALITAKAQRALLGVAVAQSGPLPRAWVRAAIFSGEAAILDASADAAVRALTATDAGRNAKPVRGPSTANAATSTVDWYYELPAGLNFRAGERVAVEIPVAASKTESLVVPFSAVLHDIHGGQWVYEAGAAHTYVRRRVQVSRISGGDAVLATGPAVGTKIVTDGAAELFGTEFMTGK